MDIQTLEIVQTANKLVDTLGTRDPHRIARELGIEVVPVDFKRQRGAYKVLMRNRFIFIKNDLHPVMESIVMLHEIGHDVLHRKEAVKAGGFKEFNIFNMQESRMEYEANVFASQVSLGDEEILEYIRYGYDIQQIATAMHSDTNLVALKTDALIAQGYCLHHQEYENRFLNYHLGRLCRHHLHNSVVAQNQRYKGYKKSRNGSKIRCGSCFYSVAFDFLSS